MMRVPVFLAVAVGLSACASQPRQIASCPALTPLQKLEASEFATKRIFGEKHGGYHIYTDGAETTDARGNIVFNYKQIGPASEPQPGPGEGGRMRMVVQPCTGKVLSFSKL